ncbi:MAG TPA: glycoside hydrolase family 57 protein, partial [Bryobacteraceae bacterium]|nr:glycoside hydrolase family 57 protein [Bryobacteraceae bacterium]
TTPFFHPILPLVIDTDFTRRARPDLPLPSRFRAPDDAEAQLQRAVAFHTATFGHPPAGLWPSEGSVCPELLPLVRRAGLQWLATDEGVLARSLDMGGQPWDRSRSLYQPYRAGEPGQEVTMVFRDRDLSDAFGFVYHKTDPDSAADDVLRRLRAIVHNAPHKHLLIPIILDGENPWEHYHDGGEHFLSRLYRALTAQTLDEPGAVRCVASTMSEGLAAVPPAQSLSHLHSGSWINQDYKIWIGHAEDNRGWDLLGHTRTRLVEAAPTLPTAQASAAWNELYAAEGSDWFWWYGDDFETDFKPEFDRLFRTHLRNVWTHMGLTPPDSLNQPICAITAPPDTDRVMQPVARLSPAIDGVVTDFFEWRGAGTINTQPPLGAMWKAEGLFTAIRFGWSDEQLFLRLDPDEAAQPRHQSLAMQIVLHGPRHPFRLAFSCPPPGPDSFQLFQQRENGTWEEKGCYRSICAKAIVELAIPVKDLSLEPGDSIHMSLIVLEHGLEVARYPHQAPATLLVPGDDFDAAMWRV